MHYNKDAYGQEMWAHWKGKDSYEVVEREDGFVGLSGGAKAYFAGYKDWPEIQKRAIKFARGKILDIGCGVGRVGLYLQGKGLNVTGIDNSPLAIRICKARGLRKAKVLPIENIGRFPPHSLDTIIMFGCNFGLFGNFSRARRLLKIMHQITSPNALLIAESNDIYKTKDLVHLAYQKQNRKNGKMPGQLRIRIRFRNYIGDWFEYLLVSPAEMKKILAGTGWKVKKLIRSKKAMYVAIIGKVGQ